MGSATATAAGKAKVTRFDKIRHWITPFRLHCAVLAVYVILVATVMCFHEPWFDEAQAWLIARDCSWREMILECPPLRESSATVVDDSCHTRQAGRSL